MSRLILRAAVTTAYRTDRISIAAPGDFAHARWAPTGAVPPDALPYCLDVPRRRSLYLVGLDMRAAQEAPFYFLYARRNARELISIPWGADVPRGMPPIFLFSPGRCGSTLLSQVLFEAGVPNVSEPDFYTQVTSALGTSPLNPLRGAMRRAIVDMGGVLSKAFGTPLVVKLRAEFCRAPELLVDQRERRAIFMIRDFESWARSTAQAFRNGPQKMVGKYMQALTCYGWLQKHTDVLLVRYEDLIATPAKVAGDLSRLLEREILVSIAAAVLMRDLQAGTPLARGARVGNDATERYVGGALALWNSDRVKRARDRLGLPGFVAP